MKEYAAVIIPTLNRIDHLRTALESLKKCIDAEYTNVYIGLDYPPSEQYVKGYERVKDYLESGNFSVFHSFNIIRRDENYGSFKNFRSTKDYVLERHNRFIAMDDDIEVSVNFLRYTNSALEYYKNDDSVVSVSAYSYPLEWLRDVGSNSLKNNYIASVWGVGFWKDKYLRMEKLFSEKYMFNEFKNAYMCNKLSLMSDACIADYVPGYLSYVKFGDRDCKDNLFCCPTDVCVRAYLAIADKYVIMPTISHTRNHGFDGTGEYCGTVSKRIQEEDFADNYDYDKQPIDNSENYSFVPSKNDYINENRELYNHFDRRDKVIINGYMKELKNCMTIGPKLYRIKYLFKCYSKAALNKVKKALFFNRKEMKR